MGIPQKLHSTLTIHLTGTELSKCRSLSVDIQQGDFTQSYTPGVVDDEHLIFTIPEKDAAYLDWKKPLYWQVTGEDKDGRTIYNQDTAEKVDKILKGGVRR